MDILYALAGIRTPVMNPVFLALTQLGSEIVAIAVPFVIYWCFSKKKAYFVIANILFGTAVNQTLKFFCRVPRPFVRDQEFEIVEAARADAGGYSFPSGHTHNVTAVFGSLAVIWKNKIARLICILVILLVGFSRVYLGVHYLTDVLGGLACALLLLIILYSVFEAAGKNEKLIPILFGAAGAVSLAFALIIEFCPWEGVDPANHAEAIKNLNLCAGCFLAVAVFEPIERKHIRFDPKAVWWVQILKIVIGAGLVAGLRIGLKPLITAAVGDLGIGNAIRYFVIAAFAIAVWPLTFPWFAKLGKKNGQ